MTGSKRKRKELKEERTNNDTKKKNTQEKAITIGSDSILLQ